MSTFSENKNERIGWSISIGIHILLILIFFFILAWREPNPPYPEYGIEVNFGTDQVGGGDIQPKEQPVATESTEKAVEGEQSSEKAATEPTEVKDKVEDTPIINNQPSEVKVEEKKTTETKPTVEKKESTKPTETEKKPTEKTGAGGTDGKSLYPETKSQGDRVGEVGDMGNPEGKVDAKNLYGTPGGGGGGPMIEMSGWKPDYLPKPKDDISNENGRIVFEIKINAEGEIINIRTLDKTVSPAVEQIYKKEVEKMTFTKISSGSQTPASSTGKITFIIRAK